jgi:hypothetical protein
MHHWHVLYPKSFFPYILISLASKISSLNAMNAAEIMRKLGLLFLSSKLNTWVSVRIKTGWQYTQNQIPRSRPRLIGG